ncbi:extracellular solute-binding protein [Halorubellus sp. JP-L1]|uniref:extracellular solute-binding protein n=1 Tax=Halorubellus sp. JP-L1 TaxID=2715753 RepID=UPI00140CBB6E|nr:extracellular solute-binding protein [Halorubellus sp. JP-L1]NHN40213.1 extracellular solute-binding protein [Halorubellus sp. JP-L1]
MSNDDASVGRIGRRELLATSAVSAAAASAGCLGLFDDESSNDLSLSEFRGSGPFVSGRAAPEGTSMDDLDDLSGSLAIYIGGGEGGLYRGLIELLEEKYPDFEANLKSAPSTQLANTIIEEKKSGQSRADVFWSIDASSLGLVANEGYAASLSDDVLSPVPSELQDSEGRWVGVAGRARAIPYNTNQFSEDDIPSDVTAFANQSKFADSMGWGPTYGAFKSFVTAMRIMEGRGATKTWLQGMLDQNVEEFRDEYFTSRGVATGAVGAGFANHYYALRVQAAREDPPIDLAFTENDAGALVNVSGIEAIEGTQNAELAELFARHLLTAEAQEFFATRAYAYPMIPGVQPVGDLPTIDELNPPELDLTKLSDLEPTLELMREVGVL